MVEHVWTGINARPSTLRTLYMRRPRVDNLIENFFQGKQERANNVWILLFACESDRKTWIVEGERAFHQSHHYHRKSPHIVFALGVIQQYDLQLPKGQITTYS